VDDVVVVATTSEMGVLFDFNYVFHLAWGIRLALGTVGFFMGLTDLALRVEHRFKLFEDLFGVVAWKGVLLLGLLLASHLINI
jgi:hypothetical protein